MRYRRALRTVDVCIYTYISLPLLSMLHCVEDYQVDITKDNERALDRLFRRKIFKVLTRSMIAMEHRVAFQ